MLVRLWPIPLALTVWAAPALHAQHAVEARGASFTVGGRLHVQSAWSSPDEAAPADVFVRRARLNLDIDVTDFFDARLNPEFAGGTAELQDAWVRLSFATSFEFSMGQFHRAHEGFELTSSTELGVIERDGRVSGVEDCVGVGGVCTPGRLVNRLGYAGRDVGFRVEGDLGSALSYGATLTNGAGVNRADENDAKSASLRVSWAATEGIELSGFLGVHDHPGLDDPTDTDYGSAGGMDVVVGAFRDGLRLQAAAVQGDNWRAGPSVGFRSLHALASLYRPLRGDRLAAWEPVLRVGWADPDLDSASDAAWILTPGLMLYVSGRNRFGVNIDYYAPDTGESSWSVKAQSYLYF